MAKSYLDIQNSAYTIGNIMDWTNALTRLSGVPVDITEVYDSFDKAVVYAATNPVAYEGQLITVTESGDTTVYVITPAVQGTHKVIEKVEEVDTEVEYSVYIKKVGTVPTGDEASITVTEEGVVSLKGFADAANQCLPRVKVTNGVKSIEWVPIDQIVEGDTNTKTLVEVAEGSALSITSEEDSTTDTITYTLDVDIPEYSVTKTEGTGEVTYQITKDDISLGDAIVVPNAYNDSALKDRMDTAEEAIAGLEEDMGKAKEAIDDYEDRLGKIEAFFGDADHDGEGVSESITNNLNDALDTLVEIQNFLNGEGGTVKQLLDGVDQNADAIATITESLADDGDFGSRVADLEAAVEENADYIDVLETLTSGFAEGETKGAIKLAVEAADEKAQSAVSAIGVASAPAQGVDGEEGYKAATPATGAYVAIEAADAKAVAAQADVDALEIEVLGANRDGSGGVKKVADEAAALAAENAGRLDTAEDEIDVIQALVNHETKGNEKLRTDVDELLVIASTGTNANATLRKDLTDVKNDLADLDDVVNDESTGLAATKVIADNAASEAERANGRLDIAEDEIDDLQEIVDSGDGKTIRDDVTALQTLAGDSEKGNAALYTAVTSVTSKVNDTSTGLAKTKEIADGAASEASRAHGRIDVIDDILDGYAGKNGDTVKADVDATKAAIGTASVPAVGVEGEAGYVPAKAATGAYIAIEAADAKAVAAQGAADAAQGTADSVKATIEDEQTGLAATKEIADEAASEAARAHSRLDLAEDAIEDLEEVVYDASKGNAKLRDEVTALNTLTGDASKGNEKLRSDLTIVMNQVNDGTTGLAKTKEIADNAAAAASANDGRLDTIEGNYVRIGTDNKLYNGKDGDVIIFNCGSASV